MALVNPFLSHAKTSVASRLFTPQSNQNQNSPPLVLLCSLSWNSFKPLSSRRKRERCDAISDLKASVSPPLEEDHKVLVAPSTEEESVVADYDWTEEWYPLYLTQNVPDDAPLGLKVFHKQLVLFKDGNGQLHCYEDRCPHR